MVKKKPHDLIVLGASGYTGRQLVRALMRQSPGRSVRIGLAGRDRAKLEALNSGFDLLDANLDNASSITRLAASGRVLLNLAGPYAERGEQVIQACLAGGCHHLDLSGEVFWMRQMLQRHHAQALKRGLLVVPACGYEALPFDVATLAAARALLLEHGERCAQVDVSVRFTGAGIRRLSDAVSGGTLDSMRTVLMYDRSDSLQRMDSLLPDNLPEGWNANAVALRNAAPLSPWWDADWGTVMAPTLVGLGHTSSTAPSSDTMPLLIFGCRLNLLSSSSSLIWSVSTARRLSLGMRYCTTHHFQSQCASVSR
jgi:short subunit dehydrogenase-like uncharacterized protein